MKQLRTLILSAGTAFLLALATPGNPLRAQEPARAPQEHAAAETPNAAQEGAGHEGSVHEGHEGHEAHEAHGGAHHPEVVLFGRKLGSLAQFGVQVFNFAIFAAILVLLLKGTLSAAFKARAKELEDKLSQAERDKAEAAQQIVELDARMAGLQQELAGIMAKAEADAEVEKQRILESARAEAAQILAQTQAEITFQQRQAEQELRALVAELAVTGAVQRLENQLHGETSARVLDKAILQVGGAK